MFKMSNKSWSSGPAWGAQATRCSFFVLLGFAGDRSFDLCFCMGVACDPFSDHFLTASAHWRICFAAIRGRHPYFAAIRSVVSSQSGTEWTRFAALSAEVAPDLEPCPLSLGSWPRPSRFGAVFRPCPPPPDRRQDQAHWVSIFCGDVGLPPVAETGILTGRAWV